MSTLQLFKCHLPSCQFIFPKGKAATFVNGRYATDIQEEIDCLKYEISLGHPHIYIDAAEAEVDSEKQDPMSILVARIREEERQKLIKASLERPDFGETGVQKVNAASSEDIAAITVGTGNLTQQERLAQLMANKVKAVEGATPNTTIPAIQPAQ